MHPRGAQRPARMNFWAPLGTEKTKTVQRNRERVRARPFREDYVGYRFVLSHSIFEFVNVLWFRRNLRFDSLEGSKVYVLALQRSWSGHVQTEDFYQVLCRCHIRHVVLADVDIRSLVLTSRKPDAPINLLSAQHRVTVTLPWSGGWGTRATQVDPHWAIELIILPTLLSSILSFKNGFVHVCAFVCSRRPGSIISHPEGSILI